MLYMLDEAFDGREQRFHSLLGNLERVTEDDWLWIPPGGHRSIRTLVVHAVGSAIQNDDHAFGPGARDWTAPMGNLGLTIDELQSPGPQRNEPAMEQVLDWARASHQGFRDHLAALHDDDLSLERENYDGRRWPVRWFVTMTIQHYAYHAGEINHIRALHQGDDSG